MKRAIRRRLFQDRFFWRGLGRPAAAAAAAGAAAERRPPRLRVRKLRPVPGAGAGAAGLRWPPRRRPFGLGLGPRDTWEPLQVSLGDCTFIKA